MQLRNQRRLQVVMLLHHVTLGFVVLPPLAPAAPGRLHVASPLAKVEMEKRGLWDGIKCLTVGSTATANWTNSRGQTCKYTGIVGSNYGTNPSGSGDYSCNGRCGAGCTGIAIGDVYTQDCFSHDICSYFNSSTDGASDPNCGGAYSAAADDTAGGLVAGCSQTNPSEPVQKPRGEPICN